MFVTDDLAFSCTKPTNIYTFQESLGFSQKIPQRMQNKKKPDWACFAAVASFSREKQKTRRTKKTEKKTHKKHAEQKKTLTGL